MSLSVVKWFKIDKMFLFSGQTPLKQRLEEIETAVTSGATEIDIVISRAFVLEGNWEALYNEVQAMRKACGEAHLKTIIATGTIRDNLIAMSIVNGIDHICGKYTLYVAVSRKVVRKINVNGHETVPKGIVGCLKVLNC